MTRIPELADPTVAAHASCLAAVAEFVVEGRGSDDTMVGKDLAHWGGRCDPCASTYRVCQLLLNVAPPSRPSDQTASHA